MGDFLSYELLPIILNMTVTASVVIVLVLLVRLALRRAPRICSYALWMVVLFRLLCPLLFRQAQPAVRPVPARARLPRRLFPLPAVLLLLFAAVLFPVC